MPTDDGRRNNGDALSEYIRRAPSRRRIGVAGGLLVTAVLLVALMVIYVNCRIDVGTGEMAILIRKTGLDVTNGDEIAPSLNHKGVQAVVLKEGRYFQSPFPDGPRTFNPWDWDWDVIPQTDIPAGKLGVLISLTGDEPPYGEFLGAVDAQGKPVRKGIIPEVLNPGRHQINPYLFRVEQHEPVFVDAGFRGVVTNLAGPLPKKPNTLLVETGERGVQKETRSEGTHYVNPYVTRIRKVDCRSQRFNLAENKDMGFPSKDGFWVNLDGRIQFRIQPDKAAEVYVTYNEEANGDAIDEEIIRKIIMPNARSFCRLKGSNKLAREFIDGEQRLEFEQQFRAEMVKACEPLGIEIQEALITHISWPTEIAEPIQKRESARLEEETFQAQIAQQQTEITLAEKKALALQKAALVQIEQAIIRKVTEAKREQEVAVTKSNEKQAVALLRLAAAKDEAAAVVAKAKAKAEVIGYGNKAEAAGWKRAVEAFSGDGTEYARYVLLQKLAGAYQRLMINSADSPLMKVFDTLTEPSTAPVPAAPKLAGPAPAPESR